MLKQTYNNKRVKSLSVPEADKYLDFTIIKYLGLSCVKLWAISISSYFYFIIHVILSSVYLNPVIMIQQFLFFFLLFY